MSPPVEMSNSFVVDPPFEMAVVISSGKAYVFLREEVSVGQNEEALSISSSYEEWEGNLFVWRDREQL